MRRQLEGRGCPYPLAGRSLRPSWASLAPREQRFAIHGCACSLGRLRDTGSPDLATGSRSVCARDRVPVGPWPQACSLRNPARMHPHGLRHPWLRLFSRPSQGHGQPRPGDRVSKRLCSRPGSSWPVAAGLQPAESGPDASPNRAHHRAHVPTTTHRGTHVQRPKVRCNVGHAAPITLSPAPLFSAHARRAGSSEAGSRRA
jgi:hypothetical protein